MPRRPGFKLSPLRLPRPGFKLLECYIIFRVLYSNISNEEKTIFRNEEKLIVRINSFSEIYFTGYGRRRRRRKNLLAASSPHPITPRDSISRSGIPLTPIKLHVKVCFVRAVCFYDVLLCLR